MKPYTFLEDNIEKQFLNVDICDDSGYDTEISGNKAKIVK
jgi:hypothetical protein